MEAAPRKFATKFILTRDRGFYQQFLDHGVTLLFHWLVFTCSFTLLSSKQIETKEMNLCYV
jgi:hypothetical protein